MGSESDLESINLSDIEGDVLGEESVGEDDNPASQHGTEIVTQAPPPDPQKPLVGSMAARMAAARAAKKQNKSSSQPPQPLVRPAPGTRKKPIAETVKQLGPSASKKRGSPGRPKKDAVIKKAQVVQSTPPVIEVDDDSSDDDSDSSSESSSSDDGRVEYIADPPHPLDTPGVYKTLAKQQGAAKKVGQIENSTQGEDEDDVALMSLASRRTTSRAQKPTELTQEHPDAKEEVGTSATHQKASPKGEGEGENKKKVANKPRATSDSKAATASPKQTSKDRKSGGKKGKDVDVPSGDDGVGIKGGGQKSQPKVQAARSKKGKATSVPSGLSPATPNGSEEIEEESESLSTDVKVPKRRGRKPKIAEKDSAPDVEMVDIAEEPKEVGRKQAKSTRGKGGAGKTNTEAPRRPGKVGAEENISATLDFSSLPGVHQEKKPYSRRQAKGSPTNDAVMTEKKVSDQETESPEERTEDRKERQKEVQGPASRDAKAPAAEGIIMVSEGDDRDAGPKRGQSKKIAAAKAPASPSTKRRGRNAITRAAEQTVIASKGDDGSSGLEKGRSKKVAAAKAPPSPSTRKRGRNAKTLAVEEPGGVNKGDDSGAGPGKGQREQVEAVKAPASPSTRRRGGRLGSRNIEQNGGERIEAASSPGRGGSANAAVAKKDSPVRKGPSGSPKRNGRSIVLEKKRKTTSMSMGRASSGKWLPRKAPKTTTTTARATTEETESQGNGGSKVAGEFDQDFSFFAPDLSYDKTLGLGSDGNHDEPMEISDGHDNTVRHQEGKGIDAMIPADIYPVENENGRAEENVYSDTAMEEAQSPTETRNQDREYASQHPMVSAPRAERRAQPKMDQGVAEPHMPLSQRNTKPFKVSASRQTQSTDIVASRESQLGDVGDEEGTAPVLNTLLQTETDIPLPTMTDKDEPLQAMMLCQQLQRSYWDFADTQDDMIDRFLRLLRKRSNLNRSRSGNELLQAWASPDERQYLRRQKWCAEVNFARVELRRMQEHALEDFARKVSAAQESHVNTLGDFFLRTPQGEVDEGMHDPSPESANALRRASLGFVDIHKDDGLGRGRDLMDSDALRGNVRFSLPAGSARPSISSTHVGRHARTPPILSFPDASRQTPLQNAPSSEDRKADDRPRSKTVPGHGSRSARAIRKPRPVDVNPALSVENARSTPFGARQFLAKDATPGDVLLDSQEDEAQTKRDKGSALDEPFSQGSVPVAQEKRRQNVGSTSPSSDDLPMQPVGKNGAGLAPAKVKRKGKSQLVPQADQRSIKKREDGDIGNGVLETGAKAGRSLRGKRRSEGTAGRGPKASQKAPRRRMQYGQGEKSVMLSDNTAVRQWVRIDFANLGIDCFRSRAILKVCDRAGGITREDLHAILPFRKPTLLVRLEDMKTRGFLHERRTADASETENEDATTIYTTVIPNK